MSRLAELIRQNRSDWPELPDDLERAWAWLEDHGYATDAPGGYCMTVSGDDDSSILFTADGTLEGWLEPDEPGHADVLPIGEADGSGSIIALWRDGDAERVVLLGSDGERGILAQDAREFLTLLAIGYDELSGFTLGSEPEEPVDTNRFREWLEGTFDVTVPSAWPALSDRPDDFGSWLAKQLGEEPDEAVPPPSDSPGARIDGELTRFMALLGEVDDHSAMDAVSSLLDIRLGKALRSSTKGIETIWITTEDYPRAAALISGLVEDPTRAQVLSFLGEPEKAGEKMLRYVISGRYVHFEFDNRLTMITLMVDAP
jgi:hypothetical protein